MTSTRPTSTRRRSTSWTSLGRARSADRDHLDIDVLDSALTPAVDSPQPDGLTYEDLSELLGVAVSSPLAVGLEITIFDPDRDPDGALAARLTDAIIAGFRRGGI